MMQVYAVLREDWSSAGGHTVCASQQTDVADSAPVVYTSKSNVIEARLVTQNTRQHAQFLLKVERILRHFTFLS